MRSGLTLLTPPVGEPIGVELAKRHLRVDIDDDDDYIEELISMVRDYVETRAGVSFLQQTWIQNSDGFPYPMEPMDLLRWPVQTITSVKFRDAAGNLNTMLANQYILNGATRPPRLAPAYGQYWPMMALQSLDNVKVEMVTGFATAGDVPPRLRQILYMTLAHWYEHRMSVEMNERAPVLVPEGTEEILSELMPPLFA